MNQTSLREGSALPLLLTLGVSLGAACGPTSQEGGTATPPPTTTSTPHAHVTEAPPPVWDVEATTFVNFETPHVHPLEVTPDGRWLLAVNLPDARLEVFDLQGGGLTAAFSVPVGMDPVTVRARTSDEVWVINHVSDSISVVDLPSRAVVRTLLVGDEPADVVFAGEPARAYVSLSQLNQVWVFDPQDLDSAPTVLPIQGEDPRALTVDATGRYVLAAIFEGGNDTTIINQERVSSPDGPYGGVNPPPNSGEGWSPAMAEGLDPAPPTGHIVRKDTRGRWIDDNQKDWSALIPWDVHGHDVAIIDTQSQQITYASRLMNLNMALAPMPDGSIAVVGLDSHNEVRFEPNVQGRFVKVLMARFDPARPADVQTVDLNPHLDYKVSTLPQSTRDLSIGDPRAILWRGEVGFVAGMGSGTVIVISREGQRLGQIEVGAGPTGLAADPSGQRLFVLNKFSSEVVEIDPDAQVVLQRVGMFDPTPEAIKLGRPLLYDTRATSGLGQASCASCHIDARIDHLAWDLGDPRGAIVPLSETCFGPAPCGDWHPMKGPLTTQTLVGIIGTEPFHWRGDRDNFAAFKGAFTSLLGDDAPPTDTQMEQFEAFVATLKFPPNPYRELDNALPRKAPQGGDAVRGQELYLTDPIKRDYTSSKFKCIDCHTLDTGTNGQLVQFASTPVSQAIKTPQLRNLYERQGFDMERTDNNRGFGFFFDGEVDTLYQTLDMPALSFPPGQQGVKDRLDLEAMLLAFSSDPPAGVGAQVGLTAQDLGEGALSTRLDTLVGLSQQGQIGLVAHLFSGGEVRGYALLDSGTFQSDRAGEQATLAQLKEQVAAGASLTITAVARGTQTRIGIDRDADGTLNGDEGE